MALGAIMVLPILAVLLGMMMFTTGGLGRFMVMGLVLVFLALMFFRVRNAHEVGAGGPNIFEPNIVEEIRRAE
jgi:hypothetical protein